MSWEYGASLEPRETPTPVTTNNMQLLLRQLHKPLTLQLCVGLTILKRRTITTGTTTITEHLDSLSLVGYGTYK